MTRPMLPLVLASLLAGLLAACSTSQTERPEAEFVAREPHARPSGMVLNLPPQAGPTGRVTERRYVNGLRQSMSLDAAKVAGDWNDLAIDIETGPPAKSPSQAIPMGKPTKDGVRREILARFPQTPMRIVDRPMANSLGPFGLAVGAAPDGARCAFAWQWIDDIRAGGSSKSFLRGGDTPASIRMRLCRKGATADQLAGYFERLSRVDVAELDRVLESAKSQLQFASPEPAGADPSMIVGSSGPTLESYLPTKPAAPAKPLLAAAPKPPAPAPRRQARRRIEPRPPAPPADAAEAIPPPQNGRQYLAPVAGDGGGRAEQGQVTQAPRSTGQLDPSLPSQAYRGPARSASTGLGSAPAYLGQ